MNNLNALQCKVAVCVIYLPLLKVSAVWRHELRMFIFMCHSNLQ